MTSGEELDLKLEWAKRRARRELLAFTKYTKKDYEINWHHKTIARKLDDFISGKTKYLMVFVPPRHGKSELVSRRLPAFLHGLYPDAEIMAVSYLDSLAGDMTIDVQKIIDSPEYKEIFPETAIWPPGTSYTKGTRNSSEHHIVGRRGKYRGQGVGGSFTGKGANFICIDDPIKGREIADSLAFRERLWNFYNNDLFSRLETNLETGRQGQVLITQTRWHSDDLPGRLLELMNNDKDAVQWDIIDFPAVKFDSSNADDPRTIGDALWPSKYNVDQLNQIKASAGPRAWSALYQQRPMPAGGGFFEQRMFENASLPDKFDYTFITADTAYKDKENNDFTVFVCWGVKYDNLFLVDAWRDRLKAVDVEVPAEAFVRKHSKYGFRGAFIEPEGHGIYLNQSFLRKGLMMPSQTQVDTFYKDRVNDKVERASAVVPYLSSRKVYVNDQLHMKDDLISEALAFPKGMHDDFVDCLVDAVKHVFVKQVSILDVL